MIDWRCFGHRRDWRRMGCRSEGIARGILIASYRRRMGITVVREMARHRYRQSQYAGLSRLQLQQVPRERQRQRDGAARAVEAAERAVEIAQGLVIPAFHQGNAGWF